MPTRTAPDTAEDADSLAFRAARESCRRCGGDLYAASAFLPRAKRNAVHAVFAFGEMVREAIACDDGHTTGATALRHRPLSVAPQSVTKAPGSCCTPGGAEQRLSLFRARLNSVYDGTLELPAPAGRSPEQHVLHAFALTARRFEIPRQSVLDFAEGCRADAAVSRYATWTSLRRLCSLTGGSLGLMVACVLGLTHSGAAEHAVTAGVALRFTSILANLRADVATGRIYLPLEDLAACRYSERELSRRVVNDRYRQLMRLEVDRARDLYRSAAEGVCWVAGDGSRLAASTLLAWSAALLDAIGRQGYDVFSQRPSVTKGDKLRRLALAWRLARRRPGGRMPELMSAVRRRRG